MARGLPPENRRSVDRFRCHSLSSSFCSGAGSCLSSARSSFRKPSESPVELTIVAAPEPRRSKSRPTCRQANRSVRTSLRRIRCSSRTRILKPRRHCPRPAMLPCPHRMARTDRLSAWRTRNTRRDRSRGRQRPRFSRARRLLPNQDEPKAESKAEPKITPKPSTQLALLEPPKPKSTPGRKRRRRFAEGAATSADSGSAASRISTANPNHSHSRQHFQPRTCRRQRHGNPPRPL